MSLFRNRLVMIASLLCLELLLLAVAHQFLASIECQATDAVGACRLLRSFVARAVSVFAALAILSWARPAGFAGLVRRIDANQHGQPWMLLHLAGIALLIAPLVVAHGRDLSGLFSLAIGPWVIGAAAASFGALFWLAPPGDWLNWLREERFASLLVVAAAFLIPDLADLALPLWESPALLRMTFVGVLWALKVFSAAPVFDPGAAIIGMDGFNVHIARQCSGVEGFALVTGFSLLYAFLFRGDIRLARFWLVVIPLGLALSWVLNVLRISALIWIGSRVSPELAVNGFHSYAGWLFFTLLALALLYGAQSVPWLRAGRPEAAAIPPRDDWVAARIVPFVAFMLASVAASALSPRPDLAYPVKVLAMAAALCLYRGAYRRMEWSFDPVAVGAGVLVGVFWVLLRPPVAADEIDLMTALANLGAASFVIWAVLRVIGAVLLVPLVEELFFRGYVLARLDSGGAAGRAAAIAVSTALFAALHGRWLAAGVAGLVFALAMLRRGRLADAITAHVAANLIVALWAIVRGDWAAL